ncbi:MAG: hypothetical protein ABW003_23140 [Microvirga sp.]|jgi:hypothetical protein
MSNPEQNREIAFAVEIGPKNKPILKVKVRDHEIPLGLTAAQAGELGCALLAVSAVCSSAAAHPEGTRIDNCHFPVMKWATGRSQSNGLPILVVEVTGGTQLALQFAPKIAEECAASLRAAAALATAPKASVLSRTEDRPVPGDERR